MPDSKGRFKPNTVSHFKRASNLVVTLSKNRDERIISILGRSCPHPALLRIFDTVHLEITAENRGGRCARRAWGGRRGRVPLARGFLRPMEGIFETLAREFGDLLRGILRPNGRRRWPGRRFDGDRTRG